MKGIIRVLFMHAFRVFSIFKRHGAALLEPVVSVWRALLKTPRRPQQAFTHTHTCVRVTLERSGPGALKIRFRASSADTRGNATSPERGVHPRQRGWICRIVRALKGERVAVAGGASCETRRWTFGTRRGNRLSELRTRTVPRRRRANTGSISCSCLARCDWYQTPDEAL